MALFNQFFPNQRQQVATNKIDPQQFKQLAITLDKQSLQQLVQQARQKGIADSEIEAGLNFILNLQK